MRKALAALGLAACLTTTSCLGPNNAYDTLHSWNSKVTDSKIVNELIFLGLNIIPVYGIFLWADYIIFNSIEWWGAENIIKTPEPFESQGDK